MESKSSNEERRHTTESVRRSVPSTSNILGVVFGIFMVIVYVGVGVLLFINFFNWGSDWAWTRWVVGAVLIVYGIFRGYRTYATLKSHGENDQE